MACPAYGGGAAAAGCNGQQTPVQLRCLSSPLWRRC